MELTGRILYEADGFLLLDKPPGVSVHNEGEQPGLVTQLSAQLGRPLWLVHRLDKLTSGLMLLATNQSAASELGQQFEQRRVDKLYLAISARKPRRKQGRISGDMEKGRDGSWLLRKTSSNPATTEFISRSAGDGRRLFLCHPLTGKTHQIRVALKSEGSPIIGDQRYAGRQAAADRGYLHAWMIGFELAGQRFCFRCDPHTGDLFQSASVREGVAHFSSPVAWPRHWHLSQLLSEEFTAVYE